MLYTAVQKEEENLTIFQLIYYNMEKENNLVSN